MRPEEYIIHLYARVKARVYTKLLAQSFFRIGKNTTIIPPLRFWNLNQIQLGNRVTIHANSWIQVLNNTNESKLPKLIMEDNVSIGMNATISAARKIIIEEHVFTARNVYISDHGHEFHDVTTPIALQGVRDIREVIIGAHSWLGQNAVILPGVRIGKHCVVGANSVVNQDIPDYSVAVGVPARVLRTYNKISRLWEEV